MDSSVFMNLVRGNRLTGMMGLKHDDEKATNKFGPDYAYVEIPVRGFRTEAGDIVDKVKKNQRAFLEAAVTLDVKGRNRILAVVNPKLHFYAQCPGMLILEPGQGDQPEFACHFKEDFEAGQLEWAVRLYMLA